MSFTPTTYSNVSIIFFSSLSEYDFKFHVIQCASPSGITSILKLLCGFLQALFFIYKFDVVIGFGGYPSFPTIVAAKLFGKKIILHEQNAVLGKVNRTLQRFASHVGTSFNTTKFAGENAKYVGSFVRDDFRFSTMPAFNEKVNLLIIGGSQGAKIFSDIFPEAIATLPFNVTHQVPEAELERTKNSYKERGLEADIKPFFVDIRERIANAHLVVSRAGSSSIFELVAIGRPAIFVPLPNAADNHQYENARELMANNAAWLVEENQYSITEINSILRDICLNPTKLVEKAEMMHNQNQVDSKQKMLALIEG